MEMQQKAQEIQDQEQINLKKCVLEIFERHEHQADVLIDLYQLVFPNWNQIEYISQVPKIGTDLWLFISRGFVDFDLKHHPEIHAGGLWMDLGFSNNDFLGPWDIDLGACGAVMKKKVKKIFP